MFEAVFGFLGGVVGSWLFLLGVFFFAILAETRERLVWSIILGVLTAVSLYFTVGLTALTGLSWWALGLIYISGGAVHSLWRWFRSTSIITEKYNEKAESTGGELHAIMIARYNDETDYRQNLDKITYWILAWPISGAAHFLGDLVSTVQKMIVKLFSGIFDSITDRARSKATFKVSELDD